MKRNIEFAYRLIHAILTMLSVWFATAGVVQAVSGADFSDTSMIEDRLAAVESRIDAIESKLEEKEPSRSTEEIYDIYDDNRYEVVEILLESPKLSLADAVGLFVKRGGAKDPIWPDGKKVTGVGREIVFFWATWCGPCGPAKQSLGDLKDHDDFKLVDIDSDNGKSLKQLYNVNSVPTVIYLHDGVEITRAVGTNAGSRRIVGGWLNPEAYGDVPPEKRKSTRVKVRRVAQASHSHSGPGHTHRCGACGASWSHENWNVGNPSAHTCPSCGNLEWGNRTEGWSSGSAIRSRPVMIFNSGGYSSGGYSNCPGGVCPTYR